MDCRQLRQLERLTQSRTKVHSNWPCSKFKIHNLSKCKIGPGQNWAKTHTTIHMVSRSLSLTLGRSIGNLDSLYFIRVERLDVLAGCCCSLHVQNVCGHATNLCSFGDLFHKTAISLGMKVSAFVQDQLSVETLRACRGSCYTVVNPQKQPLSSVFTSKFWVSRQPTACWH